MEQQNKIFEEIKKIIKNKYNIDVFNISNYNLEKTGLTIMKLNETKNKKMILYSTNTDIIKYFCITSGMGFSTVDYIIFYLEDFLTFNNKNYIEVINGQMLKKIIIGDEEDDKCCVCYENYNMFNGFSFCFECGSKICVKCLSNLENSDCVVCRKKNAY